MFNSERFKTSIEKEALDRFNRPVRNLSLSRRRASLGISTSLLDDDLRHAMHIANSIAELKDPVKLYSLYLQQPEWSADATWAWQQLAKNLAVQACLQNGLTPSENNPSELVLQGIIITANALRASLNNGDFVPEFVQYVGLLPVEIDGVELKISGFGVCPATCFAKEWLTTAKEVILKAQTEYCMQKANV